MLPDINMNPYLLESTIPFWTVIGLSMVLMYQLAPIGKKIDLVDTPDSRKRHKNPVPLVGGISISVAIFLSVMLVPFGLTTFRYLFFSLGVLVVIGVLDDHQDVSARTKIVMQFAVALILVLGDGLVVTNIGDVFSWDDGNSQGLSWIGQPLTILAIVGVINALNMSDGHDGTASAVFLLTVGSLILLCSFSESWKYQYILALFFLSVAVHFCFNFVFGKKHQIFLGDAGSMVLGLVVVYALINLSEGEVPALKTVCAPWIFGLPLLDMFAVISLRLIQKKSPFLADRQHIHHVLMDRNYSRTKVLLIIVFIHTLFCTVGVVGTLFNVPDWVLFWPIFPIFVAYFLLLYRHANGVKNRIA